MAGQHIALMTSAAMADVASPGDKTPGGVAVKGRPKMQKAQLTIEGVGAPVPATGFPSTNITAAMRPSSWLMITCLITFGSALPSQVLFFSFRVVSHRPV